MITGIEVIRFTIQGNYILLQISFIFTRIHTTKYIMRIETPYILYNGDIYIVIMAGNVCAQMIVLLNDGDYLFKYDISYVYSVYIWVNCKFVL